MAPERKPVLIIGAGVVGLTLANGLQQIGVPFRVFERDAHVNARGQGWAITLHWALPFLHELVSPSTFAAIESAQVDPDADRQGLGNFVFINLATLEPKFIIPPGDRRRVNREKMRLALLSEVEQHVSWSKRLSSVQETSDGVEAVFEDGTEVEGCLLVGAEGSNSRTRKILAPETYKNIPLPVRCIGAALDLSPEQVKPLKDIDPLLFQGCHPATNVFFWFSMLETPLINGTAGTGKEHYRVQIIMSWPIEELPEGKTNPTDTNRLAEMRTRAQEFHPVLRKVVDMIPENTDITEIMLQDWPCLPWNNHRGKMTLAGDAAHAMTMYRGEAANHGIVDAHRLYKAIGNYWSGTVTMKQAIDEYETELRERTRAAVLLSRQACLDAHDFAGLNENSAVLKKRAIAGM
ncbi:FAD/NAD(P)-binding domain-containing protein [Sarocladium strictum]